MRKIVIKVIAKQLWKDALRSRVLHMALVLAGCLVLFAGYSGWKNYKDQNAIRKFYQEYARESWNNNPDKHPHRMAHYGSFAFRLKHKLSVFDFGMESYTGNAVFLEAHKQNTINFSEASLSTGLLRFGEINFAMLLKVIVPLLVFYLGFGSVARERENNTLKILLAQGTSWKEILFGKWLGLLGISALFFVPILLVTLVLILIVGSNVGLADELSRYIILALGYLLFFCIISAIAVGVSTTSASSKDALIKLLGIWLFFVILLPKTLQAVGYYLYPTPSKIEFESKVEHDLIDTGDSHNANDPHFKAIKDSVLLANNVTLVEELPFNYSGFIMAEGEKLSANIYKKHLKGLLDIYRRQNGIEKLSAFVNPYTAIKHVSIAFSGTDFASYVHFQEEAEQYRYQLAQKMNALQKEFIPNKSGHGSNIIDKSYWKAFPDFKYEFLDMATVLKNEALSLCALLLWSILAVVSMLQLSKKAKAL